MNIRHATDADLPRIADLWEAFIDLHADLNPHYQKGPNARPAFLEWCRRQITQASGAVLVAERDRMVVAYCLGMIEQYAPVFARQRYGLISDLAVDEAYRDHGIGEKLVERMLAWFRGERVTEVHLFVLKANSGACRFWRRLGWSDFVEQLVLDLEPMPGRRVVENSGGGIPPPPQQEGRP